MVAIPFFLSKSGQNCKTWLHWPPLQFVHPLHLKLHNGCGNGAVAQSPQRWFGARMFGEFWSSIVWSAWYYCKQKQLSVLSDKGVSTVLQKSIVPSTWHDCRGSQIFCRSCFSFLAWFCGNKLSRRQRPALPEDEPPGPMPPAGEGA